MKLVENTNGTAAPYQENDVETLKRRREDGAIDWRRVAPRWLLLAMCGLLCIAVGALFAMVIQSKTKEQERIEAALADVPSKYQARQTERLAQVEVEIRYLRAQVDDQNRQLKEQSAQMNGLIAEIRLLNTQLKRRVS